MTIVPSPPDLSARLAEHLHNHDAWCAHRDATPPALRRIELAAQTAHPGRAVHLRTGATPAQVADLGTLLVRLVERDAITLGPRTAGALILAGLGMRAQDRAVNDAVIADLATLTVEDGTKRLRPTQTARDLIGGNQ